MSTKKDFKNLVSGKAVEVGKKLASNQELAAADKGPAGLLLTTRLSLANIKPRAVNLRPILPDHVGTLIRSILGLGYLIQPIAVDVCGITLAGAHRRVAILGIKAMADSKGSKEEFVSCFLPEFEAAAVKMWTDLVHEFPPTVTRAADVWATFVDGIPVHQLDIDSSEASQDAVAKAVELVENTTRLGFSAIKIKEAADLLVKSGRFTERAGAPAPGETALAKQLMTAFGCSYSTVRRALGRVASAQKPKIVPAITNPNVFIEQVRTLILAHDNITDIETAVQLAQERIAALKPVH